jgi:hypothetical protein
MFLLGGPAFSGTTLLALLVNQGDVVCLDEPDFHDPAKSERGIPFLRELFPDRVFPERPLEPLSYDEAVRLIQECEAAIRPRELGIKTCDWPFLAYAEVYRRLGYPVICIVRDIRDALVRELPDWVTEEGLNRRYRMIWARAELADLVVRYEDLVADTDGVMRRVSETLGHSPTTAHEWRSEQVHRHMLKLDRHELLKTGAVSGSRVDIWRGVQQSFAEETHETARLMGY